MTPEQQHFLREHYLFAPLQDGEFAQLRCGIKQRKLAENETLFDFGEQARFFYLLQSGQVMLYRLSPTGDEKVIEIIQSGQTFAEAVMFFQSGLYPVSAKAVLKSDLFQIDMATFRALLQSSTALCFSLMGGMSKRLHMAIQDIEQLTLQNAHIRVIQLLLQSVEDDTLNHYQMAWDTPKHVIASRLSLRPETFSRVLNQLSKKGFIEVQGKLIKVLDVKALRKAMIESI